MAKKTAMVQPPPSRVVVRNPPSLEDILKRLGNNRAYTVISHKDNVWLVHFEGDTAPKTITSGDK